MKTSSYMVLGNFRIILWNGIEEYRMYMFHGWNMHIEEC